MAYDPTRLIDGPSGWEDRGFGHLKDMHNYPGPGMFSAMEDRVSVLGEFGGLGLPLEKHLWQNDRNWGYRTYKTHEELADHYQQLMTRLHPLIGQGLAAAVYTQTTDVEGEVNGLLTYDRKVIKIDPKQLSQWHAKLYQPPPVVTTLLPTARHQEQTWRYRTESPAKDWATVEYNDAQWTAGPSGFGTKITPGTTVRTTWDTSEIWIRRTFALDKFDLAGEVMLTIFHDEDAEVYINGILAAELPGYTTEYVTTSISAEAVKSLHSGENVHCDSLSPNARRTVHRRGPDSLQIRPQRLKVAAPNFALWPKPSA